MVDYLNEYVIGFAIAAFAFMLGVAYGSWSELRLALSTRQALSRAEEALGDSEFINANTKQLLEHAERVHAQTMKWMDLNGKKVGVPNGFS